MKPLCLLVVFFFVKLYTCVYTGATTLLLHVDIPQLFLQFVDKHGFRAPRLGHIFIHAQLYDFVKIQSLVLLPAQ